MDSQQIEIIGRNIVIEELINADFEIAVPIRDRGLDLIAYTDLKENTNDFKAIPIQIKTASKEFFGVARKYDKIANILIVYLWNINNKNRKIFALWYKEAVDIARKMGWTKTNSWKIEGYSTPKPSVKLKELLVKHEMNTDKWKLKIKKSR